MTVETNEVEMIDKGAADLAQRVEDLKALNPGLRARDVAAELGVSECALLSIRCGDGVVRLDGDFKALIKGMPAVGRVMVLTRNEHVVHERHGEFGKIGFNSHVGIVLNETVDLRIFINHWAFGFCVNEVARSGTRTSLQFFDRAGVAVHKIYLVDASNRSAFDDLVALFVSEDQLPRVPDVTPYPEKKADTADEKIDRGAMLEEWSELKDPHDFRKVLSNHGVGRHQAMRLAEGRFTERAPLSAMSDVLLLAASRKIPIMVFVANRGCIQIHTGLVENIKKMGDWLNVLDPDFNLHLREDRIVDAFIVRKPSDDGTITSLEVYDADNELIVTVFGLRKPGNQELEAWRTLTAEVAGTMSAA
ncbi:hemin-degrading factor [Hwanghaeella grinnelliae]|uniref:Hemin-degrading factor n=1 Tax=Hwanghaeella grinnelliae TaxID=2500179 RepID=A0A437QUQ0_9PROT|nr:ChuX/HutX family heme-like substrate-binding protein [Hwanghaeella grinnelliae]RVU38254.1 hemin-degrading factor [Hwanghaeella grinnelliae]